MLSDSLPSVSLQKYSQRFYVNVSTGLWLKALLCLWKSSAYLYVMMGIALALFILHWQLQAPLLSTTQAPIVQSPTQQEVTPTPKHLASHQYEAEQTFYLAPSMHLNIKQSEHQPWLTIVKNNKIYSQFSSRETATMLTLSSLYNIALVLLLPSLAILLLTCRHRTFTLKMLLVLSGVLLSQGLMPWSVIYPFIAVITDYLMVDSLLYFMIISGAILCYLPSLVREYQQYILGQYTEQPDNRTRALIAYASQSGTAADIAKKIAKQLPITSHYHIACVSSLQARQLIDYQQVFLLASTYGDGEPPEQAIGFMSSLHKLEQSLSTVKYSVLAFGDKQYPKYCAFGHQLCAALQQKGAQALMPVTEVNKGNQTSIQLWWQQLSELLGWHSSALEKSWQQQQVLTNVCLNPHNINRPAHYLSLTAHNSDFSPGDLVEILPKKSEELIRDKLQRCGWAASTTVTLYNQQLSLFAALQQLNWQNEQAETPQALVDKLPVLSARTYSIASCSAQGVINLLVRKVIKADNSVGLCSGYLATLSAEDSLTLAIKKHHHFHPPSLKTPIIMIAAGTGLAPFIGFLEQRQRATQFADAWLIMGERHLQHDNYFDKQLTRFEQRNCLYKRQHAWSRNSESSAHNAKYVDEIIIAEQAEIRHWLLTQNAQLYLCGNASTLGVSCDAALSQILGVDVLTQLKKQQQIKYDLY